MVYSQRRHAESFVSGQSKGTGCSKEGKRLIWVFYKIQGVMKQFDIDACTVSQEFTFAGRIRRQLYPLFCQGDAFVVSNDENTGIHMWDTHTGRKFRSFKVDGCRITSLACLVDLSGNSASQITESYALYR
ncbi:hypothetical protein L226DRAFT_520100 [Lentinus tigrinus ALCF2SS1-7]|uniref:WD40 repeat-like protein n=1 Tax=Lentinus tigrinus ALCF2SS1-6 TaxID=1328759 RepID=A0A5C2SR54_9APHY|nr:hypothetical protein L227DRAFT_560287 [Lentinus tigrinus ALCF2SS1-6]RPD79030.1 hypothetical protein L226DRAFT_520100 [Lentinus tigrinus ALCF2SS1-7]